MRPAVGRLCIEADLPGEQSRARLEILDAAGVSVATRTTMGQPNGWYESTGVVSCRGRNTISPDLLPGSYTVVVTHATLGVLRRTVEVAAGEVATLRIERCAASRRASQPPPRA